MQGLQIGDCLGLWGDSEAPGNASDAGRSRIPGLARASAAEAGLGSRYARLARGIHRLVKPTCRRGHRQKPEFGAGRPACSLMDMTFAMCQARASGILCKVAW